MVETITPAVHGGRRGFFWRDVALHTLGATLSAALFGAALGGLGALLGAPWGDAGLVVLAAVAALYFLREAFGAPIPLFDRKRQVPDWWRTFYSPPVAALLYGLGLGVGFFTFLRFGTYVGVVAATIVSGSWLAGAAMCASFGFSRAVAVGVVGRGREEVGGPVADLEDSRLQRRLRGLNVAVLVAIVAIALSAAL
ncbi:MAG: hypothetical protein ABR575_10545 [Actinomycetota bacterium]